MKLTIQAENVLKFWFHELTPKQWFMKDEKLDAEMKERFLAVHDRAVKGDLKNWRETPRGRLAEVIVLDQFSRNIYRDRPQSFAADTLALSLAEEAISSGDDQKLTLQERSFLYMPFMHSEDPVAHEKAVKLFKVPGLENNYDFELKHKKIIDRFGRYPHRNKILGRTSTAEEIQFLEEPNSSF